MNQPLHTSAVPKDDHASENSVYDHPRLQSLFLQNASTPAEADQQRQAIVIIEGIRCAGCCAGIEKKLNTIRGVVSADLNYSTHQVKIEWRANEVKLSHILNEIDALGYRAYPYRPVERDRLLQDERKQQLTRLGVAAALGMQVMVLAVALYTGDWWGMENGIRDFFRSLSLLLTIPVIAYSAQPFFYGAWRDLKRFQVGMDVPISLGLSIAFIASLGSLISGHGEIYFDSVVMFVTFILAARYIELNGRVRATQAMNRQQSLVPDSAIRLVTDFDGDRHETVPTICLQAGDRVLVSTGQTIPADGEIESGVSSLDEALLTGESLPVSKQPGDTVVAGALNLQQPLYVRVTHTGNDTVVSNIARLMQRAQFDKPDIGRFVDRLASVFVLGVLSIAVLVAATGYFTGVQTWLSSTIAVLIVSCPCALALAAPTAISTALGNALRNGILITNSQALERLNKITRFFFDKTGTLTTGRLTLTDSKTLDTLDEQQCLQIARSLEQFSDHPLAKVLVASSDSQCLPVTEIDTQTGGGVSGNINNTRYCIGNAEYITRATGIVLPNIELNEKSIAILANQQTTLAVFSFTDEIRDDATTLVQTIKSLGIDVNILSGDHPAAVEHVARNLAIKNTHARCTPADKLKIISADSESNTITAMIGDGVNDAPVIGAADVSVAMGDGVNLATANADIVLLGNKLSSLSCALELAARTDRIMKQNLLWALLYNVVAIPFAALGYIPPWLAAIGMSLSSTIVVLNAMRLAPAKTSTS